MLITKFQNFSTRANLAFVINNKVEKITEMPKGLVYMFLESNSVVDLTAEARAATGNDKYFVVELHGSDYDPHKITCDEGMYSVVMSNPVYAEIPEGLDVQVGWNYDGANFSAEIGI